MPMPSPSSFNVHESVCFFATESPAPTIVDDEPSNDSTPTELVALDPKMMAEEPLKGVEERIWDHRSRIRFNSIVSVALIPSHRDYSEEMRTKLWASLEELR